jgi:hypothetical protein
MHSKPFVSCGTALAAASIGHLAVLAGDHGAIRVDHAVRRAAAVDSLPYAWGAHENGIACGLTAETDTVPQGHVVVFHLNLRFDPSLADTTLSYLNETSGSASFTFTDMRTGQAFKRLPMPDYGPPYDPTPQDFVPLHKRAPQPRSVEVPLLTPEGDQLPDGSYSVVASYENTGVAELMMWGDSNPVRYFGLSTFWKGTARSGPINIEVTHADPESIRVLVRSGIKLTASTTGPYFGLSTQDSFLVHVQRRPGFRIRRATEVFLAIGDGEFHRAGRSLGDQPFATTVVTTFALPKEAADIRTGTPLQIRTVITVFETPYARDAKEDFRALAFDELLVLWQGCFDDSTSW